MPVIEATVLEKKVVTPHLSLFKLVPKTPIPDFVPGQFMMVGTDVDGKFQKRAYSIVSAPSSRELEFCIKAYEEGKVAKHILNVPEGGTLKIEGPYGKFMLNGSAKNKIFIAAGTGIAPMVSMIRALTERGFTGKMVLYYGASYPNMLVYSDELRVLSGKHNNFIYVPSVSREAVEWTGARGRVESILPNHIKSSTNTEAYICGPPPMCENAAAFLKSMGFADADIHMEKYW